MSPSQQQARQDAEALRLQLASSRREPGMAFGQCRADGWSVTTETLDGDYDLDDAFMQQMLQRLGPETSSTLIGPGNIIGNAVGAMQITSYLGSENQAARALERGARQISTGVSQSVRINDHMTLYNANKGRGQPRIRLRIRGLPVSVARPIPGVSWRTNPRGTTHSTRWATPSRAQARGAQVVAADTRWNGRMGWSTGRIGGGVLAFAPSAAIDAWNSLEFEVDASGRRHYQRFDRDKFLIDSARSQSGNAVGLAVGTALGVGAAVVFGVAGAPLLAVVLIGGLAAQVVWNASGMGDKSADLARQALAAP